MNLRKRKIFSNNISIVEILQIFWKDKILIVIFSLVFFIFFGLFAKYYSNIIKNREKLVEIKVTLQYNQNNLDSYYKKIIQNFSQIYDLKDIQFGILHNNISSFFSLNKEKFNDLKIYFEKLNISSDNYFKKNYKTNKKELFVLLPPEDKKLVGELFLKEYINKTNKKELFVLLLPEDKKLVGELFLKEYIIWLLNQSHVTFINNLKNIISSELFFLKKNI